MAQRWTGTWRGLTLEVEARDGRRDAVASLRIAHADRVWLEVRCFGADPHVRFDPDGVNETRPLDERTDPVAEAFARIEADLDPHAARAGWSGAPLPAATPTDAETLRQAERALRHRPAVLEDLDPVLLRSRRSEKWHTYPADVLPVWVAEMDFPIAAPIQDELRRFVDSGDVGYPIAPRETGLPEVFAERMADRFDWQPDPSGVEILSEVVQGMYVALEAFSRPGDGVLVQTPIYPPFLGSIRDMDRKLVECRMAVEDDRLAFDLDALEAAITPDTRVFLFCNPHNPSGRVLRRDALERIATLAIRHDLIVVSDEIHSDLIFDGAPHVPLASLGPEIAQRTITLNSASKSFNIPGLRTAIAHFGDRALQKRFNEAIPRHARGGIGLYGLYATLAAWRFAQPWLDEVVPHLDANRDVVTRALAERIPEIRVLRPAATYLAWLDCTALELDGPPGAWFLRHGRVALSDGRNFGPGWEAFARLNFATSSADPDRGDRADGQGARTLGSIASNHGPRTRTSAFPRRDRRRARPFAW